MPAVLANPKNANEISFEQRARDLKDQEQKEQEELKQQRKSPFSRFYQVNKDNSEYLRSCLRENPKALELLFHLRPHGQVQCSYLLISSLSRSFRNVKSNNSKINQILER